jgi:antitoxin ParD1/3/4
VRRDQQRARVIAELQSLISQGIESGVSEKSMSDILVAARAAALGTE